MNIYIYKYILGACEVGLTGVQPLLGGATGSLPANASKVLKLAGKGAGGGGACLPVKGTSALIGSSTWDAEKLAEEACVKGSSLGSGARVVEKADAGTRAWEKSKPSSSKGMDGGAAGGAGGAGGWKLSNTMGVLFG